MDQLEKTLISARHNFEGQQLGLEAVPWIPGRTVLDIGCGPGVHLDYLRSLGLIGVGLDRDPTNFRYHGEIEHVTSVEALGDRQFDYVFASHVLEHCPDTFATLLCWRDLVKPGGMLIIFVPPFMNEVSIDHWCTGWNVGQLAMAFVATGFTCKTSTFYQNSEQVFGFGAKLDGALMNYDIEAALEHLPSPMATGLQVHPTYVNLRGDIALLTPEQIEYVPRRSAHISIPPNLDGWREPRLNGAWNEGHWDTDLPAFAFNTEYILAIDGAETGGFRICMAHDGFENRAEKWFELKPGLNLYRFELADLAIRTGNFDPARIERVYVGGEVTFTRYCILKAET